MDEFVTDVGHFEDGSIKGQVLKIHWTDDHGPHSRYEVLLTEGGESRSLAVLYEDELQQIIRVLQQAREFIEQRFDEYPVEEETARLCEVV